MNTNTKVYTYYEYVDEIDNCKSRAYKQNNLISICKQSWVLHGWDFIILSHQDAKNHPFYEEYNSIVKIFPSVNPGQYDYHCYIRWLAMAQVGGGLMIDYDVVNYDLTPENSLKIFNHTDKIAIYQGHVPCVVNGTQDQYLSICKKFTEIEIEKFLDNSREEKHISDMIILSKQNFANNLNKIRYVTDYPTISPLVHCSQSHCASHHMSKLDAMNNILSRIKE